VSYQVFARKYRPRTFSDVLGQDHVVQTLRNAIEQDRLAHAYLFVGPRGTGKTSTARILAKALNAEGGPCIDFDPEHPLSREIAEGSSLDVLEIDGASNNSVEQIRALRETAAYAPSSARFKIYYIDEVHMLSNAAFNALLKTLEEPPAHVKFIFATTEANKILPTIISRCQRFDLRPIPTEIIANHLRHISDTEGVSLDDSAAWAIAKGADGGMRDAQSMLDQLVAFCGEHINESNVLDIFGFTSRETVSALLVGILEKNPAKALEVIHEQFEAGKDLSQLLNEVVASIRALVVHQLNSDSAREGFSESLWADLTRAANRFKPERLLKVIDTFSEAESRMKWASNKRLHLEVATLKSIQHLNEIRLSDVISAIGKADPSELEMITPTLQEPQQSEPLSKPLLRPSASVSTIDQLIAQAPEVAEMPEEQAVAEDSPPQPVEDTSEQEPDQNTSEDDQTHEDPLIKEALHIFKGRLSS